MDQSTLDRWEKKAKKAAERNREQAERLTALADALDKLQEELFFTEEPYTGEGWQKVADLFDVASDAAEGVEPSLAERLQEARDEALSEAAGCEAAEEAA